MSGKRHELSHVWVDKDTCVIKCEQCDLKVVHKRKW